MKGLLGRFNWGLVGAVLFSLGSWAVACSAQTDSMDAAAISVKQLDEDLGVTVCYTDPQTGQGRMSSFVRVGVSPQLTAFIAVHEMKHQEQASRFGFDCSRYIAWYNTPVGMLMSESEAYMAEYCVQVKLGADPVKLRQDYARRISGYFGGEVNMLTIVGAMNHYDTCPEMIRKAVVSDTTIMPGWGNDKVPAK